MVPKQLLPKSLPTSVEAERAVLGALLLNDSYVHTVSETLTPADFYVPAHTIIYKAVLQLIETNKRIDLIALQDYLAKEKTLESAGGISYLMTLQEEIPMAGLVAQHTSLVKEKAVLRELIQSAADIIASCYDQDEDAIDAVLDHAEQKIFQIANKRTNQSFVQLNIWLKKTFDAISDSKNHTKGITGVATSFKQLDFMTSGFQKSDFIVLAARPSMGKTALALVMAEHAASLSQVVGFFSLEMSAEQLTLRLLSMKAHIPLQRIKNAAISSQEWLDLTYVAANLANQKMFIDDTPLLTLMELRAKARKLKNEHGLDLLVIDYLQLIRTNKKYENRHQEVSDISRSLKALAKELQVPIIALSQLSRAVDARVDKRPMLSDLRESGAIEQDADLIMFLYRDSVYNPETENPALSELIIGKQRNGPTGTVFMNYVREFTRFEDMGAE
ncbi:MAG: replicative DNA helicase [Candidatus Babeliales bacterium]